MIVVNFQGAEGNLKNNQKKIERLRDSSRYFTKDMSGNFKNGTEKK